MKRMHWAWIGCAGLLLTSCGNDSTPDQIVSESFVHKYGFDLSKEEWENRPQDGKVVSVLKNGVKVSRSYENGQLHGPTTYTFPHSSIIEKAMVYDQGTLLKETVNDISGMPIQEEVYEFDNRTIVTLWDDKGTPLSIEEYENEALIEGKYYNPDHELEARVEAGFGEKIKRDRAGLLVSRDLIENGITSSRTTYHPNGHFHTISHYLNDQLHGKQMKFSASGKPLMELNWKHGILDGTKIVYRNGLKVAEIPYVKGHKEGTELHYDDLGNLTAEIHWRNDKKHGCSQFFSEEGTESEWFYKGQSVNAQKFEMLENREKWVAELTRD